MKNSTFQVIVVLLLGLIVLILLNKKFTLIGHMAEDTISSDSPASDQMDLIAVSEAEPMKQIGFEYNNR